MQLSAISWATKDTILIWVYHKASQVLDSGTNVMVLLLLLTRLQIQKSSKISAVRYSPTPLRRRIENNLS
jgi:hypothetical protein